MTFKITASPDFNNKYMPGWFIFNTWLQKRLGENIHLDLYNDFKSQREAIATDQIDMIFANPYDASLLVREKGFVPVAHPIGKADEAVIVVREDSAIKKIEDLKSGVKVATTDDPDVFTMGMIMLEAADLFAKDIERIQCDNYILVGKQVINGAADVGFFLREGYDELSDSVRKRFRELVSSQIYVLRHVMLVGPRLLGKKEEIKNALLSMKDDPKSAAILKDMGVEKGWEEMQQEDVEFMIDLMDTLLFQPEG